MKELIVKATDLFNALKARERVLVVLGFMVLMYMLWQNFFAAPNAIIKLDLIGKISVKETQIADLQKQYDTLIKQLQGDQKYGVLNDKIDKLRQLNRSLESEIVKFTEKLISPSEMPVVLERILEHSKNVKLINLTNITETSLFEAVSGKNAKDKDAAAEDKAVADKSATDKLDIYKHGMVLEVEGTYFDIMAFLFHLERAKWNLIWEELDYEVTDYPIAHAKITIYTLSLSAKWLNFD